MTELKRGSRVRWKEDPRRVGTIDRLTEFGCCYVLWDTMRAYPFFYRLSDLEPV